MENNTITNEVSINPMVDAHSVPSIVSPLPSADSQEEEGNNEMFFTLPPVVSSTNSGKSVPHTALGWFFQLIDVVSINLGSICFIVGSVYFYPSEEGSCGGAGVNNCMLIGADLFIIGSFLFLQGTVIVFFHSGAYKLENLSLVFNLAMYLVANVMFVVGSFFFIPDVMTQYGPYIGVWLFIIGSLIFVISPAYNLYRATGMLQQGVISRTQYMITTVMCTLYMLGSTAFVVGSVLFLPNYFEPYAITIFVWGSVAFMVATLLAPLKYSWRVATRTGQSFSDAITGRNSRNVPPVELKNPCALHDV